jgi:hypothetical protein
VRLRSYRGRYPPWKIKLLLRWPSLGRLLRVGSPGSRGVPTRAGTLPVVLQPAESKEFKFRKSDATIERMMKDNEYGFISVETVAGREVRNMAAIPRVA